jgi:hypothetical protein
MRRLPLRATLQSPRQNLALVKMFFRLARSYIYIILAIEALCLIVSILMYVAMLTETMGLLLDHSKELLAAALFIQVPAICLAKERNIWKNELRKCPWWLRILVVVSFAFVLAITLTGFVSASNATLSFDERFISSAFVLHFSLLSLSVIYSVLWS